MFGQWSKSGHGRIALSYFPTDILPLVSHMVSQVASWTRCLHKGWLMRHYRLCIPRQASSPITFPNGSFSSNKVEPNMSIFALQCTWNISSQMPIFKTRYETVDSLCNGICSRNSIQLSNWREELLAQDCMTHLRWVIETTRLCLCWLGFPS